MPSREYIREHLAERGAPLTREALTEALGLTDAEEIEALRRRLNAMVRDGELVQNRRGEYGLVGKMNLVRGRVTAHPDGFGFLIPDDGTPDLFLSPREMRTLLHGDRAVGRVVGVDRRGRREGAVVEVLERANRQVVGRYFEEAGIGFVVPDNRRLHQDIVVPPDGRGDARAGQIVVVDIVEQPSPHSQPVGRVAEVLGDHMAPGMEVDVAIRAHGLPATWPQGVEAEAAGFGEQVPEDAKKGRTDLRRFPLVTIDGADAKDFDDAVYAEPKAKGWRVIVAIADVSSYVSPGTALDREARERGNSVYFPDRVIPMLPEALSNGLCSLNPRVDRLCMVADMYVGGDGRLKRSQFYEAVMRSAARLTYGEVAAMLVDRDPALRERYASVLPYLKELHRLYKALRARRDERGAIDFETTETRIHFDDNGKIDEIVPVERNDAHRLIEECMVTANVAAARFLIKQKMPTLFRVHEGPDSDKLEDLRTFLGALGLKLGGGEDPGPKDYERVLRQVRKRPDRHMIETVMLRSLSQAVYSPENVGHFGLACEAYTHFTSPIRRYPDLLVHRAIRHALAGRRPEDFRYGHEDLKQLGEHCSSTDRRAEEATRDAEDWLKCEYMMDRVGEEFDGYITGVTSFGIFVELKDIYATGLVHVTNLRNDYYHFDPVHHRLTGENTGTVYRLADPVRVKVVRVDLDERKIDFEPVGGPPERTPRGRRGGGPTSTRKKRSRKKR
ncbi:MAG: ribonuclease R [Gammaproteobacteria bacterium]|nr:ribonuclease R [Gammaproteobacteria bacterium]